MPKILIISSIIPIQELSHKKNENDILFVTEDKIKESDEGFYFKYLYIQPYSNDLLGIFSNKWTEYAEICKKEVISTRNRDISIFPIIRLPKKNFLRKWLYSLSILLYNKRLNKVIKEFEPDLVHAQNVDSNAFIARYIKKKYNIPYLVTLREISDKIDNSVVRNINGAQNLLAISPTQKRYFTIKFKRDVKIIPHGLEEKFFLNNQYTINNQNIKVVIIARLLKYKNIDKVIRVFKNYKNFELDIIGEGSELEHLKSIIEEYKLESNVHLLGKQNHNEILKKLPQYNLFILTSFPETLGRVYFEVMASGIPIIASKNTGVDGIITHGKEGFLVDSNNPEELESIINMIEKKPEILIQMGLNAKNLVKKYKWNNIAQYYINFYNDIN